MRDALLLSLLLLAGCPGGGAAPLSSAAAPWRDRWADLKVGDFAEYDVDMPATFQGQRRYEVRAVDIDGVGFTVTQLPGSSASPPTRAERHVFTTSRPVVYQQRGEGDERLEAAGRTWACRWMLIEDGGAVEKLWFAEGAPPFLAFDPRYGGAVKVESGENRIVLARLGSTAPR